MENSADPDQTPHFAASDLGLDCKQMHICPNAWGCYGNVFKILLYVWKTVQTLIRRRILRRLIWVLTVSKCIFAPMLGVVTGMCLKYCYMYGKQCRP